jgi:hypothetical protein
VSQTCPTNQPPPHDMTPVTPVNPSCLSNLPQLPNDDVQTPSSTAPSPPCPSVSTKHLTLYTPRTNANLVRIPSSAKATSCHRCTCGKSFQRLKHSRKRCTLGPSRRTSSHAFSSRTRAGYAWAARGIPTAHSSSDAIGNGEGGESRWRESPS